MKGKPQAWTIILSIWDYIAFLGTSVLVVLIVTNNGPSYEAYGIIGIIRHVALAYNIVWGAIIIPSRALMYLSRFKWWPFRRSMEPKPQ